jgi:hypothetical protein
MSGPAFPTGTGVTPYNPGMTLRDYFAAKAMQVLIANDNTDLDEDARDAYMIADMMLKAREK